MSGTSLDGIDVCIAEISGFNETTKINYIAGITIPWSEKTYLDIKDTLSLDKSNIELISKVNYKISYEYYEALNKLCLSNNIKISDLDFIAIHGQTVWHDPINKETPSTLQLGSGAVLSALAKTTVISNFREKDIVIGGQGAPLVPFVDKILFNSSKKVISAHNLGGISNLTILKDNDIVVAYDTGPANMMIDYYMKKLYEKDYDEDGKIASSGNLITEMYNEVMELEFFKLKAPKSTGRELFGDQYSEYLLDKYQGFNNEDYVHTATMITVDSIVDSYNKIIKEYKIEEIIFSGGGAHNKFILNKVKELLPSIKILTSNDLNVSIDFKEALAFIILGNQTFNLKPSDLKKATGSKSEVILGEISYYL